MIFTNKDDKQILLKQEIENLRRDNESLRVRNATLERINSDRMNQATKLHSLVEERDSRITKLEESNKDIQIRGNETQRRAGSIVGLWNKTNPSTN